MRLALRCVARREAFVILSEAKDLHLQLQTRQDRCMTKWREFLELPQKADREPTYADLLRVHSCIHHHFAMKPFLLPP